MPSQRAAIGQHFWRKAIVRQQIYDPLNNMVISTLLAAIPVGVMLVCLGFLHIKARIAAGLGLLAAIVVAVFAYGMPMAIAGRTAAYRGFTGLLSVGCRASPPTSGYSCSRC